MSLLALTTFMSFFGAFIPVIVKSCLWLLFLETRQEMELQADIIAIRREMSEISMVDEFARHARLQRKLNKLQNKIKTLESSRRSATLKFKMIATYTIEFLMGLLMLYVIWNYKYTPVVILPEDWLYPFSSIFRWPTGIEGGVSISNWIITTGTVARLTSRAFKW